MKLKPSLRQKKRYIVFEIVDKQIFKVTDVKLVVQSALASFLGELGQAKAGVMFLPEKFKNNKFVVKVNHKYVKETISALILIKKIKNNAVIVKSIAVSGTLKKANSYI